MIVRAGSDADAAGFIRLIGDCWAEYPGCVMDVDGECPELRALATYFAKAGGGLWAAEADDRAIVGMVATLPEAGGVWELCRMYVSTDQRGHGLAGRLLATAEAHAVQAGGRRMELWSDSRFTRAHRFYEKQGYLRGGASRDLHDLSHSVEYDFHKMLKA